MILMAICLLLQFLLYFMNKTNDTHTTQQATDSHQNLTPTQQQNNNQNLQLKIKELIFNIAIAQQRCNRYQAKEKEYERHLEEIMIKKKEEQFKLMQEIKQLKMSKQKNEASYQKLKKELELVKIIQNQKNRITVSAAIHNTQQEIDKQKLEIEQEFLSECEELKMEMKQRQEKIIVTLKKLHSVHNNDGQHQPQHQQYSQIIQFIKDIGNIEDLNANLHKLKAEILKHTKQNRLLQHQLQSLQLTNAQLYQQVSDLKCSIQMLESEKKELEEQIAYLKDQLQKQRTQNKQLESYYSQKWIKQFQIFKLALQKVYESKLIQLKGRFEQKVAAISTSEQKHINLHKQDEKIICTLEHQIVVLTTEIKTSRQTIVKLQTQNTEIKEELKETQKVMETEAIQKYTEIIAQQQEQITQLRKEVVVAIRSKESCQNKMNKLNKTLKEKFEIEKKNLEIKLVKEKEEVVKAKEQQIQQILVKQQHEQAKHKTKQQSLKHQLEYQVSQLQARHKKQSVELSKQLEQSRSQAKEMYKQVLKKEKTIHYEMEQFKKSCAKELDKMKKEIQEKNIALKSLHQRLKHDQNVKRQLRYLYDMKMKEYNQLLKQNQSLSNAIVEKENQINQLNRSIIKNDWQNTLKELKNKFSLELLALSEIHWKQVQHYRNKVYQLESIICKTFVQDQQKMDSLCNHNSMLQTKLQLMRRRYTQQAHSTFIPPTPINFIQPRRNMFMSKRKKRSTFAFSQTILKKTKENSTAAAIVRMKRFLSRGKSTDIHDKSANTQKCVTNTSPIGKHVYISTER